MYYSYFFTMSDKIYAVMVYLKMKMPDILHGLGRLMVMVWVVHNYFRFESKYIIKLFLTYLNITEIIYFNNLTTEFTI